MSGKNELLEQLRDALDMSDALALLRNSIQRQSVTPNETEFVDFLHGELEAMGATGIARQPFEPGRTNLTGLRSGEPDSKTVMLIGHTDTVHVRDWANVGVAMCARTLSAASSSTARCGEGARQT